MDMRLYVIFDKLAAESGPIFEAKNDAVAKRNFDHAVKNTNPSEYSLLSLGSIDHATSIVSLHEVPVEVFISEVNK